jgi:hypothetical protein
LWAACIALEALDRAAGRPGAGGGLGFADIELETLAQPDALPALANRAIDMGVEKEAIIDILNKHSAVKDRALYYTMVPTGFERNGRLDVEYLRAEQEIYAREGRLTDPVDVATLADHQHVDDAAARLGRQ